MKLRLIALSSVLAALTSVSAQAHGPDEHGSHRTQTKPIPTTCEQLADTAKYSNDTSNPAIKALKEQCDAKKKESSDRPK
jgi:hypothetical protein